MIESKDLIVLTSPPASGKTYWIASFKASLPDKSILVVSPLRALADECKDKWQDSIIVVTPEEWIGKPQTAEIVIFDEFHLFYYWGDTFRPLMWEMFFESVQHAELTVLLTATLNDEIKEDINLFNSQFDQIIWVDCGNQKLKYLPHKYFVLADKKMMSDLIYTQKKNSSVKLIFCQYRQEVFQLEKDLTERGFKCISCVGGESRYMKAKFEINPKPDFIISTTVLSHGVNLPEIRKIFFTYKVSNQDFWIQMTARGGRRGEKYEVYSLEKPYDLEWNPALNLINNLLFRIKIHLYQLFDTSFFLN